MSYPHHPHRRAAWLAPVLAALILAGCGSDPAPGEPGAPGEDPTDTIEPTPEPAPEPEPRPTPPPPQQRASTPPAQAQAPAPAREVCSDCGRISSIQEVREDGDGSGVGAVTGAVVGGVLGSQIGSGRGRKLATVIGAAGGAYGGHQAEKNIRAGRYYQVNVAMDEGGNRTLNVASTEGLSVGQNVRVVGETIQVR